MGEWRTVVRGYVEAVGRADAKITSRHLIAIKTAKGAQKPKGVAGTVTRKPVGIE
jgi:hypothetical protein